MQKMNIKMKWIFCFLMVWYSLSANAQQNKVDSIIYLLRSSNKPKGLDTAVFQSALQLIQKVNLTDSVISTIENEVKIFNKGIDEDLNYLVKYNILLSLTQSDVSRAIDYGKLTISTIEKSKTPHIEILKSNIFRQMRQPYRNSDRLAEGLLYYNNYLSRYIAANDSLGIADCYYVLGGFYRTTGLMDRAIYNMKKSLLYSDSSKAGDKFFSLIKFKAREAWINNTGVLGEYYTIKGDYEEGIKYTRTSLSLAVKFGANKINNNANVVNPILNLLRNLVMSDRLDSVEYFLSKENDLAIKTPSAIPALLQIWSLYELKKGNFKKADSLLEKCWETIRSQKIQANYQFGIVDPDYYSALIKIQQNKLNEAAVLLNNDLHWIKSLRSEKLRDYKLLGDVYEKMGDNQKVKETYKLYINLQDSILADQAKFRTIGFEAEQKLNESEISITKLQADNKVSNLFRNFSIAIAVLLLLIAVGFYNQFLRKKKDNTILEETINKLKSTQSQLVQSEKMASLGELTAGIAHEIQNPLNFVNNFSEVNKELVDEMQLELKAGKIDEAITISNDIKENEEKINHHGKRADAIVKGMLQHSRSSSGVKESTDINALADEYLRLAYHGLRAKDKSFNANMKMNFDKSIGNINIIPQDIGRVILNLITNAFYVVDEKKKSGIENYEPTVSVSTKKLADKILISVKDNGNGIPQKVMDKIFQPFFTTKPTGQGTGLGLSLSYDIVKAHGGEIKVETKEGEGTEFVISLPV